MRRAYKVAIGVTAAGLLSAGGIAYASIPDSSTGEFHACVKDAADGNGHMVRFIDSQASETCSAGWTENTWAQVGPTGPAGAAGATGAAGGLRVPNAYEQERNFSPGSTGRDSNPIYCPTGTFATGGGFWANSPDLQAYASTPIYQTGPGGPAVGWNISISSVSSGTGGQFTAYVLCVDGS